MHGLTDGKMFSVKLTPWHKLGTVLTEAPTLEQGMELAGHNYEVTTRPLFVNGNDGEQVAVQNSRAVVRTDTSRPLGIVSDSYVPIQNIEVFEVLKPLLDRGVCKLETGGTLFGGESAWMMARFNVDDPVVREVFADEVVPFALLRASHTGKQAAMLCETPIRVVCANTLTAAAGSTKVKLTVRHYGNTSTKLVEAAETMFAQVADRYRGIAQEFRFLKERKLTAEVFTRDVLDTLFKIPTPDKFPTERGFDIAFNRTMMIRTKVTDMWREGSGHTGDESAWEAYNGLVEVLDHDEELFRCANRLHHLANGRFSGMKEKVYRRLLTPTV